MCVFIINEINLKLSLIWALSIYQKMGFHGQVSIKCAKAGCLITVF